MAPYSYLIETGNGTFLKLPISIILNSGSPAKDLKDTTVGIHLSHYNSVKTQKTTNWVFTAMETLDFTYLYTFFALSFGFTFCTASLALMLTACSTSSPEFQQILILFLSSQGLQQCSHILWLSCVPLLHTMHHFCYALWKSKCIHVLGQLTNMEAIQNVYRLLRSFKEEITWKANINTDIGHDNVKRTELVHIWAMSPWLT
jgi:hypothetical protein